MKRMKENELNYLTPFLAKWMSDHDFPFTKTTKKVSTKDQKAQLAMALGILKQANSSGLIKVLKEDQHPIAVFLSMKAKFPRIRGERAFFFEYDQRHGRKALVWVRTTIRDFGKQTPRYTRIGISKMEDAVLAKTLKEAGFNTKYEILYGKTIPALHALIKKKNPPLDLHHLGLEIKALQTLHEVNLALRLQKIVFSAEPQHGYFAHTATSLRNDRKEYLRVIRKKRGRILGVFKNKKMLGFMGVIIQENPDVSSKSAGFTFCLHPSVRGLGVSKTGYRILLSYLKDMKVVEFSGGTSRPEIKSLGKLMKREMRYAIYVKN
ncbi:MAG: hypothetical protein HYV97_15640 [Bdellovibrio sp.]|nr:hypothetical protein [Bdellovibrio sp.]